MTCFLFSVFTFVMWNKFTPSNSVMKLDVTSNAVVLVCPGQFERIYLFIFLNSRFETRIVWRHKDRLDVMESESHCPMS